VRTVFVDTSFYVAILDASDDLHGRALSVLEELYKDAVLFVTTEVVMVELLAFMSRRGPSLRQAAVETARQAIQGNDIELERADTEILLRALDRYERRADKTYSLADCIAMEVCVDAGITEVLTSDRDFEQEGFVRLLVPGF
jgi:predicted nucleic acid-binding protein